MKARAAIVLILTSVILAVVGASALPIVKMESRTSNNGNDHGEYALIEYMSRRRGEVVTRAEISEHVWDENFDAFSNLIEVYIQRLRRKIDEGQEPRLIRALRGEGYMLTSGDEGRHA